MISAATRVAQPQHRYTVLESVLSLTPGVSVQSDFSTVAGCTDFNSGQYQLTPGQSSTGCVVFQVPTGVSVKKIEWSPSGGLLSDFGTWNVTG